MREVAADAGLLQVSLGRGSVAARMVIAELDAVMNVIADGLHACPAAGHRPEWECAWPHDSGPQPLFGTG